MLGLLNRSEYDLENWTFRQFDNAYRAYRGVQEAREQEEWERVRWSTSVLLNIQLDKKSRIAPEKLLPLPWDSARTPKKAAKITPELIEKLAKEAREIEKNGI